MLNYVLKLKANPDNPAYNCVFKPDFEDLHDVHKNEPKPLSLRVRPLLQAAGVDINSVEESVFPATPPWTLPIPEVRLDLTSHKKAETPDPVYFHGLQQILADFPGFRRIFTDGSKSEDGRVGAAAVMDVWRSSDSPGAGRMGGMSGKASNAAADFTINFDCSSSARDDL
nr:hypothetical protein BaRGS_010082 [Batillaria attramentaria]